MLTAVLSFLFIPVSFCNTDHAQASGNSDQQHDKVETDSLKIDKLLKLAQWQSDKAGNMIKADSLLDMALRIASSGRNDDLLWQTIHQSVRITDLDQFNAKALTLVERAEQLIQDIHGHDRLFDTYIDFAMVHHAGYRFDESLDYAYKALSVATNRENDRQLAEAYMHIGRGLEGRNDMIDAFRNYISAVTLAEKLQDANLIDQCYKDLSRFYSLSKLRSQAIRYTMKRDALLRQKKPVDSVALMWISYELQAIDMNARIAPSDDREVYQVLDFALRNHCDRLRKYQVALYRSRLIEANDIKRLHDFYFRRYPGEWVSLRSEIPALFFRLKALFCESDNKSDSAHYYFGQAARILDQEPNLVLKSKFYHRYGQFLIRQNKKKEALTMFLKSFEMAEKASYLNYMILASGDLETLYADMRDFRNAYQYAAKTRILSDSLSNLSKKDQILILEIDHETRQQERQAEHQRQVVERNHNLQYTAMVIAILTIFVILIMLGSLRIPEWIIRMLGFFSFIFLFEFIILLADHKIHDLTHGEPWKIMLIKIFLIAILLPMHHSIEKRVIGYLLSHQLIRKSHFSFLAGLGKKFRQKKPH
jgi:tetratricopeptide (TPR) repeat protein